MIRTLLPRIPPYRPSHILHQTSQSIFSETKFHDSSEELKRIIANFHAPIQFAFAYGSGIFPQISNSKQNRMIDLIICVKHPEHWHSLNLTQHPHHYSSLRFFGSQLISWIQDNFGAKVYFLPFVQINNLNLKYGVVSSTHLLNDLLQWNHFYLAGRMQKPILILKDHPVLRVANQVNLTNAVRLALLTLPSIFNEFELFETITAFSYTGDFRMKFGEHPRKVRNIVSAQMGYFHSVYSCVLDGLPNVEALGQGFFQQNTDPEVKAQLLLKLPPGFFELLKSFIQSQALRESQTQHEIALAMACSDDLPIAIKEALSYVVAPIARSQSIKGILTAGLSKSLLYAFQKLSKSRSK